MDRLKECPFCGSNEQEITGQDTYEAVGNGVISITCKGCSTDLWMWAEGKTPYKVALKKAVAKWNTRAEV